MMAEFILGMVAGLAVYGFIELAVMFYKAHWGD